MRLDEAKLEELRRWGQALREAADEGSVAAGRAILMLGEELDRLRLELRRTREQLDRLDRGANAGVDAGPRATVESTLHGRLQRVLGRDADQSRAAARPGSGGDPAPNAERDSNTAAARTWIETLRGQK